MSNLVDVVIGASYNSMLALLGVSFVGFQMMLLRVRAESDELEPVFTFETPFELKPCRPLQRASTAFRQPTRRSCRWLRWARADIAGNTRSPLTTPP